MRYNLPCGRLRYEINPLTPAGISLAESEFHARSAFHKSRKGFISLRSVLKGTTLKGTTLISVHFLKSFYVILDLALLERIPQPQYQGERAESKCRYKR